MIIGVLVWVLRERRADMADAIALGTWLGLSAALVTMLWELFSRQ